MKLVAIVVLGMLALAEAGIVSPLFYPSPAANYIFPYEFRKVITYGTKPTYTAEILKSDLYGNYFYTVPVVEPQIPAGTQLFLVPTLRTLPSTVVAGAKAASSSGIARSSVVAHSDEAVPYSVVANAGPGAAYSSAVVHPSETGAPVTAGAHASVSGH